MSEEISESLKSYLDSFIKPLVDRINALETETKTLHARLNVLEGQDEQKNDETSAPTVAFDVFISLHVGTSLETAKKLKSYLTTKYYCSVFLCTEMMGGSSFRDQIVDALESCKVFIPLINVMWAESGECSDEFNHARRLNLISHKIGKTHPPAPRLPVILPVYYQDFNFLAYKNTRLLASSVNFIPLNIEEPVSAFSTVLASIEYLHPDGMPALKVGDDDEVKEEEAKVMDPETADALALQKSDVSNSLLTGGGGTFVLSGQTVNDYDGNTTVTDRCLLTFTNGRVTGTIDYKAGTLYNSSDISPIEGTYDVVNKTSHWIEIYHQGQSHFEYHGIISDDRIHGTYFWREKPTATGTFEFMLERWL